MKKKIVAVVSATALLSGCASIVDGKHQILSVDSRNKATQISGASCKLINDKGTWYVTTPGTTSVQRSYQDLNIQCEKTGHEPSVTVVKSSTKGMAFGNILFGGPIGAGIDVATGAAYDYPSPITVELGDLIDPAKLSRQGRANNPDDKSPDAM